MEIGNTDEATKYVLQEIQQAFSTMSKIILKELRLPSAPQHLDPLEMEPAQRSAEVLYQMALISNAVFNDGQKQGFNNVMNAILSGASTDHLEAEPSTRFVRDRSFFLYAPGETGKTFAAGAIQGYLKSKGKHVVTVASSGVAAQLLDDGRTAHSAFQIPIAAEREGTCTFPVDFPMVDDIRQTDLVICVEILMTHIYNLEAVDRALRDVTCSNLPFAGKAVLLIGDFRQIFPVVRMGNRSRIDQACFERSRLHPLFNILRFEENMRLLARRRDGRVEPADLQFPSFLLQVEE